MNNVNPLPEPHDESLSSTKPSNANNSRTPVDQEALELDNHITLCARDVWGVEAPNKGDKLAIAKLAYQLKPAEIHAYPYSHKMTILKVRELLESQFSKTKENREKHISSENTLSLQNQPSGTYDGIIEDLDKVGDFTGDALWGAAIAADSVSQSSATTKASVRMDLASSSIGFAKTLKNGFVYFKEKIAVMRLQRQKNRILTSCSSKPDEQTPESIDARKNLRQVEQAITAHQNKIKKINEKSNAEALMNSAFFASSVTDIATTSTVAVIASAAIGSVAVGGAMVGLSGVALKKGFKKEKELSVLDGTLMKAEQDLLPNNAAVLSKEDSTLLQVVRLKRDNVSDHQKKEIWHNRILAGLAGATGAFMLAGGVLSILAKAGIAVAAGAFMATGIGVAVVIGAALLVGTGVAISHYRKERSGLMPKITIAQNTLQEDQKKLSQYIHELSKPKPTKEGVEALKYEFVLESYLSLNQQIEQEKSELEALKALHQIDCLAKKGSSALLKITIDGLSKENLQAFWDAFKLKFDKALPELDPGLSLAGMREFVEVGVGKWIARGI